MLPGYFRISLTATMEMIERALPIFAAAHSEMLLPCMTDPDHPGMTVAWTRCCRASRSRQRSALLAGLAGGLFAAIVMSYIDNRYQYHVLAAGLLIGLLGAILLTLRENRR